MKIVVIRASMFGRAGGDAIRPLLFSIIAELAPSSDSLAFWDECARELPMQCDAQVIAISTDTFSAKRAYLLAKRYKRPDNLIVIGGFHAAAMPEECLQYADVVLTGDAEETWPDFLRDVKAGKHQRRYDAALTPKPMAKCIMRAGDPLGHYQKLGVIQFSRGCKFGCEFCSIKAMYPGLPRHRPFSELVEQIRNAPERLLFFIDDNLFVDKAVARELFEAIRPLRKKWACQISIEIAFQTELLKLMQESGCILVLIGFESLRRENLQQMHKRANLTAGDYKAAIANLYQHNIMVYGTFVLGYDFDTPQDIAATVEFAMENRLAVANFNPLIPMPGTPLYTRLEQEGRLLYKRWWLSDRYHYGETTFQPRGMTPQALADGCKWARFTFYNRRNRWERLMKNPLHRKPFQCSVYWLLNAVSAKEIHRKQDEILGGGMLYAPDTD